MSQSEDSSLFDKTSSSTGHSLESSMFTASKPTGQRDLEMITTLESVGTTSTKWIWDSVCLKGRGERGVGGVKYKYSKSHL